MTPTVNIRPDDPGSVRSPESGIEDLTRTECFDLLASQHLGRLAVIFGQGMPIIRPVNYVYGLSTHSVVFRTASGSKLHALRRATRAAFEIDGTDFDAAVAWSVIVRGMTTEVTRPNDIARLNALNVQPWSPGHKPHWIRIGAWTVREIEQFMFGSTRSVSSDRALMTVLFTDIVGSTEQAALLGDARWRELLVSHERMLRREVEAAGGGRVVKLIGDGSLSTFDGPARAIRCAEKICAAAGDLGVEIRAGLHTGECEVIDDDVAGIAVHIAARVSARAGPSEVLVSRTVRDLVTGSGIALQPRGEHELKGVPGSWELFAVGSETAPLPAPDQTRELRASDRVVLLTARRAPGLLRAVSRIGMRRGRAQ